MPESSAKYGVHQLLERFKAFGLTHVVISPGSRNAPLTLSIFNDKAFKSYSVPDERSAAFYAVGMAQQLQKPVAVLCTSGSALLNYYPAVAEAFYRNIPLVVISADRPLEWTDQGDGQTIRQEGVLRNHILAEVNLYENPSNENRKWFNEREIDHLMNIANEKGGPVHINFPFDEPLYEKSEAQNAKSVQIREWWGGKSDLTASQWEKLTVEWNRSPKKMIICGQLPKNKRLQNRLMELSKDRSVAILVENTSQLVFNGFIHCIDRTLNSILTKDHKKAFSPDLLITIGGAVISKKIKHFLRDFKPNYHWKIGAEFPFMDTYQSLSKSVNMSPDDFFESLLSQPVKHHLSRFGEQWKQLDYLVQNKHQDYLDNVNFSDLAVFHLLMDVVPDQSVLHLGNSSVVRYSQLFDPVHSIVYYCNRGTSGIDGSTSTAIGSAMVDESTLHTLISGDVSFFYDSNAFWNKYLPANFRIFVINNGGGGIFKIIPGPDTTTALDEHFVTKHGFSAEYICKAFDVNYMQAHSIKEIEKLLPDFYSHHDNNRPVLMEVFTLHDENDKILKDYFKNVAVEPKIFD